ncbi:MAG TPA: cardiolipin synthase ClsB [Burkholderiaceae bacterium]|nr:cardiolipin synthase ClsB [Burkholderiaceae bacterium]
MSTREQDGVQADGEALGSADPPALLRLGRQADGPRFVPGHRVHLLRGGADFFPAIRSAIDQARKRVLLETYIFNDDATALGILGSLQAAAARGVEVSLVIDGFGSGEHGRALATRFSQGELALHIYRPERWWHLFRGKGVSLLKRLHRKLAVIDDELAFVGGINMLDDYVDPNHGVLSDPRFDFAVRIEGPVVQDIALSMQRLLWQIRLAQAPLDLSDRQPVAQQLRDRTRQALAFPRRFDLPVSLPRAEDVAVAFVPRDNIRNRSTIERAYLQAFDSARERIILANAYFIPSGRFRKALIRAARRGVRVQLLLQGRVEYALQHHATQALYSALLAAGVEIHEYERSFLHAKVAVVDADWATVGSSNVDPFSLLLAREANVVVRDVPFTSALVQALEEAISERAVRVTVPPLSLWARLRNRMALALVHLAVFITGQRRGY